MELIKTVALTILIGIGCLALCIGSAALGIKIGNTFDLGPHKKFSTHYKNGPTYKPVRQVDC